MRKRSAIAVVTLVVLLVGAAAAVALLRPAGAAAVPAQSSITLTIEGLTAAGQPMDVASYSWGLSNPIGKNQKLDMSDLNVMAQLDALAPAVMQAIKSEQGFASATLIVDPPDVGAPTFRYQLSGGVTIESAQHSGSDGGGVPFESLSLHAGDVNLTVSP